MHTGEGWGRLFYLLALMSMKVKWLQARKVFAATPLISSGVVGVVETLTAGSFRLQSNERGWWGRRSRLCGCKLFLNSNNHRDFSLLSSHEVQEIHTIVPISWCRSLSHQVTKLKNNEEKQSKQNNKKLKQNPT